MTKKIIATMLAICMMVTALPMAVYAEAREAFHESSGQTDIQEESGTLNDDIPEESLAEETEETPLEEMLVLEEASEKRDFETKHFLLEDKSYAAVQYPFAVHYQNENGKFEEIDNRLVPQEANKKALTNAKGIKATEDLKGYVINENAFEARFVDQATSDNMIQINQGGYSLSWSLVGERELKNTGLFAPWNTEETALTEAKRDTLNTIEDAAINKAKASPDTGEETAEQSNDGRTLNTDEAAVIKKPQLEEAVFADKQIKSAPSKSEVADEDLVISRNVKPTGDRTLKSMSKNEKATSRVLYEDVLPNTDIEYITQGFAVKENIIVKEAGGGYCYTFNMSFSGLELEKLEDGSIEIFDENDREKVVYTIPAPFMYDADGISSDSVVYQVERDGDGYLLTVIADPEWIEAEDRVFPVTIDPYIVVENSSGVDKASIINEPNYAKYMNPYLLYVGTQYVSGIPTLRGRSLIKFKNLPSISSTGTIVNAQMHTIQESFHNSTPLPDEYAHLPISLHEITAAWNPATVSWSTQPAHSSQSSEYAFTQPRNNNSVNADARVIWNITRLVQQWYENPSSNHGVMLKQADYLGGEGTHKACAMFYSEGTGGEPYLIVQYRDNKGLEDYWTTTSMGAGRGGTASVNNHNGNMVFTQPVAGLGGNLMPVSISMIYDSSTKSWRTNYDMSIAQSGNLKHFMDQDGTLHYFHEDSDGVTRDEDGLGLELSGTTITDKNENKMFFGYIISSTNRALLTTIKDKNGNEITIAYSNAKISTITDGAGRVYYFRYNSNGKLSEIEDPVGQKVTFEWDGDRLIHIKHNENRIVPNKYITWLNYDAWGKLVTIGNIDGTTTRVDYKDDKGRALNLKWWSEAEVENTKYSFNYHQNQTDITMTQGSDSIEYTYQFNSFGQTTGVINWAENTAQHYKQGTPTLKTTTGGTDVNMAANKIESVSTTQQSNANYLFNSGFDSDTSHYIKENDPSRPMPSEQSFWHDTGYGRTSKTSAAMWRKAPNSNQNWLSYAQEYTNPYAGWYTVSGYLSTKGMQIPGDGGRITLLKVTGGGNVEIVHSMPVKYTGEGEWKRVSATMFVEAGAIIKVLAGFQDNVSSGDLWIDDLCLEPGKTANQRNLIEDSDRVRNSSGALPMWDYSDGFYDFTYSYVPYGNGRSWILKGSLTYPQYLQTDKIAANGKKGDVFSFGAWAIAHSVQTDAPRTVYTGSMAGNANPEYRIRLYFYNGSSQVGSIVDVDYNPNVWGWQFVSGEAIAPGDYTHVRLQFDYNFNLGQCAFAFPYIYKESYGTSYTYDKNGNVTNSVDLAKAESTFGYANDQLSKISSPTGGAFIYSINQDNNNLLSANSTSGLKYSYEYDSKGNPEKATVTGDIMATNTGADSNPITAGKVYYIRNADTGMALDCGGYPGQEWGVKNWEHVTTSAYQKWKLLDAGGGKWRLATEWNGYRDNLSVPEWQPSLTDNTVYLNQNTDQRSIMRLTQNDDGTITIRPDINSGTCVLDGVAGAEKVVRNTPVKQLWIGAGTVPKQSQRWYFYEVTDSSKKIETSAEYTADKNYLSSVTDESGNATSFFYGADGLLSSQRDPKGSSTSFNYDYSRRVRQMIKGYSGVQYGYDDRDLLTSVGHNTSMSTTVSVNYNFFYDEFSRNNKVTAYSYNTGTSNTLIENFFDHRNNIYRSWYGNGQQVHFAYDLMGRLTSVANQNAGTPSFLFEYDKQGRLAVTDDRVNGYETRSFYDLAGRLSETVQKNTSTGSQRMRTLYNYDDKNRLKGYTYDIPGIGTKTFEAEFGWVEGGYDPDRVYGATLNGSKLLRYGYDNLSRLVWSDFFLSNGTGKRTTYTYHDLEGNKTTTKLKRMTNPDGTYFEYEYDKNGNITHITDNKYGSVKHTYYTYDGNNQLIREDNQRYGYTFVWEYNEGGNVTSKKGWNYTTGALTGNPIQTRYYGYGGNGSGWQDQMTSYDGQAITYDAIGNPLTYRDGMSFTWQNGRQLKSVNNGGYTTTYKYNENGIRTEKVAGGSKTEYYLSGDTVVAENRSGGIQVFYIFDDKGRRIGFDCTAGRYYYEYNAQGDVVALLDSGGNLYCQYEYDPWGKLQYIYNASGENITNNSSYYVAQLNPIRYRGYYYDTETGLYYLQSRYYDPVAGRFINADAVLNDDESILGTNLYLYCDNNPIMYIDPEGYGKVYVFYFNDPKDGFKDQAMNSPYYDVNSKDVILIPVLSKMDFYGAWNSMNGDIDRIYLYLHGGEGTLWFAEEDGDWKEAYAYQSYWLDYKKVNGFVYLFSCKGGKGKEGINIAWEFAKLTGTHVFACTGGVSYTKIFGKYYARMSPKFPGLFHDFYYGKKYIFWGEIVAKRSIQGAIFA